MAEDQKERTKTPHSLDIDAINVPLRTPANHHVLSIRLSMFELRETGDWDIFLGPPERARAETGGADQWVKAKGMVRVCKGESSNSRIP